MLGGFAVGPFQPAYQQEPPTCAFQRSAFQLPFQSCDSPPTPTPRRSAGWIPCYEDEWHRKKGQRYTTEKADRESRIKFMRELFDGKVEAPELEEAVEEVKLEVKINVSKRDSHAKKLQQLYKAERLLLKIQEDAGRRVEEAYQNWLRRPITDEEILLLTAFP